jgi:hypothetical protein
VTIVGIASFLGLAACLIYRLATADVAGVEWERIKVSLSRVFRSTLVARLSLLCATAVIPLIFYVNTKEHYWTAKHTVMLFSGAVGLGAWLSVCLRIPRFRTPYAWPVGLILAGATISSLQAVNVAEGIGLLWAIFGSAVFFFLASQVLTTSKRIHLFVVVLVTSAAIMSIYGLAQSYLLLPMEHVFAQDTRAPVSTIGNKNYAAYLLDLAIPLLFALAVMRRNPLQTLLALGAYFICRWHFTLCDTRGGTISMTLGILLTVIIVAVYHGRRFRLLLYVLVLEPLLWAAMNVASLTYSDAQGWGKALSGVTGKRAISGALNRALSESSENLRGYAPYIRSWFDRGLESYLGADLVLFAILSGFGLGLFLFWAIQRFQKDWRTQLGAAVLLAFLPFLFATLALPGPAPSNRVASQVVDHFARSDIEPQQLEVALELLGRFAKPMADAAGPYMEMYLATQRNVAAMFSLSLFACFATFLLFRWYDRPEGWFPGFAVTGALGLWFLIFLAVRSGGSLPARVIGGLFSRLHHAWPVELSGLHAGGSLLGFPFTVFCFVLFSLGSLFALIGAMQYIPAHYSKEESRKIANTGITVGKWAVPILALIAFVVIWRTDRIQHVREEVVATLVEQDEDADRILLVRALFNGVHAFFNTRARYEGQPSDGAIGFRLEIYQGCLRKVLDFPVFGIGPGNFKVIHPHPNYETALERRILGKEVLGRKAHNDFLEDWVENGVFGLLGLIWVFALTGTLLFRSLRLIRAPKTSTDVFNNTLTWGLSWGMIAILLHAQFEAPLLQPASTYPTWMLFGVIFQLHRIKRRRLAAVEGADLGQPTVLVPQAEDPFMAGAPLPPAAYELPKAAPIPAQAAQWFRPWIAWPVLALFVTLLTGTILMRQFVGEMWLRWGMIFSEGGVEKFDYVFQAMEKASEAYPQQMETNYILGRYCIDAVQKTYPAWMIKTRGAASEEEREQNAQTIARLWEQYQLDVDKIVDYANLGLEVHKRDIYMNPHYKWAHNNMGVLCDKLTEVYNDLAEVETDETKKRQYLELVAYYSNEAKNCYRKALEIDDLQVYALFNLGVGAFRDMKMGRAEKYFERTLLADPRRGDVNYFLVRCRYLQQDWPGVVDAARALFEWGAERPSNKLKPHEQRETESILTQLARTALREGDGKLAREAAQVLVDGVDRCDYLALVALAVLEEGDAAGALTLANECINNCEEPISAEAIYAHSKASSRLGNTTAALQSFMTLMNSNAGAAFKPLVRDDPDFESIRDTGPFKSIMGESKPSDSTGPVTPLIDTAVETVLPGAATEEIAPLQEPPSAP